MGLAHKRRAVDRTTYPVSTDGLSHSELVEEYERLARGMDGMKGLFRKSRAQTAGQRQGRKFAEQELLIDPLTRLYNKKYFDQALGMQVDFALRHDQDLSSIYVDGDTFKAVNEGFTYRIGDETIKLMARILASCVRKSDMAFAVRFGGEEFALVLPMTPLDGGLVVAERVRSTIDETRFLFPDKPLESLDPGIGVVLGKINAREVSARRLQGLLGGVELDGSARVSKAIVNPWDGPFDAWDIRENVELFTLGAPGSDVDVERVVAGFRRLGIRVRKDSRAELGEDAGARVLTVSSDKTIWTVKQVDYHDGSGREGLEVQVFKGDAGARDLHVRAAAEYAPDGETLRVIDDSFRFRILMLEGGGFDLYSLADVDARQPGGSFTSSVGVTCLSPVELGDTRDEAGLAIAVKDTSNGALHLAKENKNAVVASVLVL